MADEKKKPAIPLSQMFPPKTADVLQALKRDIFVNMNCVQIGIVQAFNTGNQTATVQIAIKTIKEIQADGTRILVERPVLLECPVVILSGGASFLTFPIAAGDECIVLFNDREIDNWFIAGGVQAPQSLRAHDVSDGLVIVGVRSLQRSLDGYLTDGIQLALNAATWLKMTDGQVEINGNVIVNGTLTTITGGKTVEYSTHTHDGVMAGGGNTGDPNGV